MELSEIKKIINAFDKYIESIDPDKWKAGWEIEIDKSKKTG